MSESARGIAVLVLVFSCILLTGWRYHGPTRLPATLGVGALSGTLMGSTSLGTPPVMVYLPSSQDGAEVNRANFTGYLAITLVTLPVLMFLQGLLVWRPLNGFFSTFAMQPKHDRIVAIGCQK